MCTITLNNEFKGIELSFNEKPNNEILTAIKGAGFRWHNVKKVWYAKQSDQTIEFANSIKELETVTNNIELPVIKQETKKAVKNTLSLWDATRWVKETSNVNTKLTNKEIASIIRKELKSRFPYCKISVTSPNNSINIEIKESPFSKESIELNAIATYCCEYGNSYKYCTCYDPYGDYGSSYNFYGLHGAKYLISYDYKQTEQTENVKIDIENFNKQLEIFNKQEEERKEAEFKAFVKEQEEKEKVLKIRLEEEKKEIELINNNVSSIDLKEDKQYYVIGCKFAKMNKNQTYAEYTEEVIKEEYNIEDVKVTREVTFTNIEALELFKKHLLTDFNFIEGTGGSYTDDKRINSMTDYINMSSEEMESVHFNLLGIAVYYNDTLQFVINAEGYSYARYVGICDDVTIKNDYKWDQLITEEQQNEFKQEADTLEDFSFTVITENNFINTWNTENWNDYKNIMKDTFKKYSFRLNKQVIQQLENEELKNAMYKLLIEVDGIQEQFNKAALKQGHKITIFYSGGMGGIITSNIEVETIENTTYAQYKDAVKITFKQPKKKGSYYNYFYSDMLVYDGWYELPVNVLHDVSERNGFTVTSTKFSTCDKKAYDAIIEHMQTLGKQPIINTYKPIF